MDNFFRTTDIVLAAYLRTQGYTLLKLDVEGNRGTFVFVDVDAELLEVFNLGNAQVEPIEFHAFIRQLSASVRRKVYQ